MKKSLYWAAGALIAGMTFAGAASAGSLPVSSESGLSQKLAEGLTQDLSARRYCRNVRTHYWRHGHRYSRWKRVCHNTRNDCRTVVKYRWRHGDRVKIRTRVC